MNPTSNIVRFNRFGIICNLKSITNTDNNIGVNIKNLIKSKFPMIVSFTPYMYTKVTYITAVKNIII